MLFNETSLEREPFANIPYVFKEHPMQTQGRPPKRFNPFDKGVFKNILEFFLPLTTDSNEENDKLKMIMRQRIKEKFGSNSSEVFEKHILY